MMLKPFRGIFILFLIPDWMLIVLILETLGRFLGWTMLFKILITVIFVERFRGIDAMNIF